jgi:hypothetical protein
MYYFFTSKEISDVELHYDDQTRKSTTLRVDINECADIMGLALVRKSETF